MVLVCFSVIIFGVLIEYLQLFMDLGRQFEKLDMLANALGTMLGLILFLMIQYFFKHG